MPKFIGPDTALPIFTEFLVTLPHDDELTQLGEQYEAAYTRYTTAQHSYNELPARIRALDETLATMTSHNQRVQLLTQRSRLTAEQDAYPVQLDILGAAARGVQGNDKPRCGRVALI